MIFILVNNKQESFEKHIDSSNVQDLVLLTNN